MSINKFDQEINQSIIEEEKLNLLLKYLLKTNL